MVHQRDRLLTELTRQGGEFEIVERVVRGVPMRVYANGPGTLRDVLRFSTGYGRRPFLSYPEYRCDFAEHYRQAVGFAEYLLEQQQLRRGDRVAIAMRNYPEWSIVFWAVQAAGLVAVPLNAWWSAAELRFGVADSGARLVVADAERASQLSQLSTATPIIEVRGAGPDSETSQWEDILGELRDSPSLPEVTIDPDDDATIMYTSGTTGRPKGAVATHRNHCTNLLNTVLSRQLGSAMDNGGELPPAPGPEHPQPGVLITFPLFHIAGLTSLYFATFVGAKVGTLYKWDAGAAEALIAAEKLTTAAGVPTVMREIIEQGVGAGQLEGINMGGAPIPPELVRRIGTVRSEVTPSNAYGLTETTSAVTQHAGSDYLAHPDSVGSCLPNADVRVVDPETHTDLADGEVGELCFHGPNIVRGYWNQPEATAESFTGGWFHTGDLGYLLDGRVYVVDRLKDVVIRGGENVYCAEVEAALHDHPQVRDVAVFGVPHAALGEQVAAIVTLEEGATAGATALRDYLGERLAPFKVPARIVFSAEELPRTATGKVLKRQLRERVAARSEQDGFDGRSAR